MKLVFRKISLPQWAQGCYAALPKPVRRDITDRFKAARAAAPATAWGDWLIAELEQRHSITL